MPDVQEDLEQGHRVSFIRAATELLRIFRVYNLTTAPEGQLLEAIQDPGVPAMGDVHPEASALFVVQKDCEPSGKNAATVVCTYSNQPGTTWNQNPPAGDGIDVKQVKSSVVLKKKTKDIFGVDMLISPPPSLTGWKPYLSEANVFVQLGVLVFERTESNPPVDRMRAKVGKLNSGAIGPYADQTLLFADYDAQSEDGGRNWRCIYQFRHDPDGWDHVDRYHAPSGKVPSDAVDVSFQVTGSVTFADLGLNFNDNQTPI